MWRKRGSGREGGELRGSAPSPTFFMVVDPNLRVYFYNNTSAGMHNPEMFSLTNFCGVGETETTSKNRGSEVHINRTCRLWAG